MCRQGAAIQLGISAGLAEHINKRMSLSWFIALAENDDEARLHYERSRVNG